MIRSETTDIKKILYTVVSLILWYYTYEIFLWYFRTCAVLWFLWVIIWPFAFVDWLIDFKRRRWRRSKKKHIIIARTLYVIFVVWIAIFWCSKIDVAHEKFKELSVWSSEYIEVSVTEKWRLWLTPYRQWILLKVLNKMNKSK